MDKDTGALGAFPGWEWLRGGGSIGAKEDICRTLDKEKKGKKRITYLLSWGLIFELLASP